MDGIDLRDSRRRARRKVGVAAVFALIECEPCARFVVE